MATSGGTWEPSAAAGEDSSVWHLWSEKCPGREEEIEKNTPKYGVKWALHGGKLLFCLQASCLCPVQLGQENSTEGHPTMSSSSCHCWRCVQDVWARPSGGAAPGEAQHGCPWGGERRACSSLADGAVPRRSRHGARRIPGLRGRRHSGKGKVYFLIKEGLFCGSSGIAMASGAAKSLALSWCLLFLWYSGLWQQLVAPVARSDRNSGAKLRVGEEGGLNVGGYILSSNKSLRAPCSAVLPWARRLLQPP